MDLSSGMFLGWLFCTLVTVVPLVWFVVTALLDASITRHKTSIGELCRWIVYLIIVVGGGVLSIMSVTSHVQSLETAWLMIGSLILTIGAFSMGGIRLVLAIDNLQYVDKKG